MRILTGIGQFAIFSWEALRSFLRGGWPREVCIDQLFRVGVQSFGTTVVAGVSVGAIMVIQLHSQLRDFGAEAFLGALTTSSTLRNVGPVLIAFLLSGKVGAFTSAELGTMRVLDQISAVECLGVDPLNYFVVPRLIAVVVASFLLLIVGLVMTMFAGGAFAAVALNINFLQYTHNIPRLVTHSSIWLALVKSLAFGLVIGLVSCYRGYYARGGAEGVGVAVRKTAVSCSVAILIGDFILSGALAAMMQILEAFS